MCHRRGKGAAVSRLPALLAVLLAAAAGAEVPGRTPLQLMDLYDLEHVAEPQVSSDGSTVAYVRQYASVMTDSTYSNLWSVRLDGSEHRPLTTGDARDSMPRWSADGTRILYLSDRSGSSQIHVLFARTGQSMQLTRGTESPINPVWSPDGTQIAFAMRVAEPQRRIGEMPEAPPQARWAAPPRLTDRVHFRNEKSGDIKAGTVHLFVVPAQGGTPRQVTHGNIAHQGRIEWTPDGQQLLTAVNANEDPGRYRLDTDIFIYRVADGSSRRLTDRRGPDDDPALSPDGRYLAYSGFEDRLQSHQSRKLHIMELASGRTRILGEDLDRSLESPRWAPDGRSVHARFDDRGTTKIARFALTGGYRIVAEGLSSGAMANPPPGDYDVAQDGRIVAPYSRPDFPGELAVWSTAGMRVITAVNADLAERRSLSSAEEFWFRSSHDGRQIQAWMLKPPGFDPARRYPLILEIHGGPISNYGPRFDIEKQLMAAHGYVVLYLNYRGSTSYGEAFGNLLYDAYPGAGELADLLSGVDAAVAKGYIDERELFISGGSAGGTLSAWAIAHTQRFRAAAVLYPVVNWVSLSLTSDIGPQVFNYFFIGPPWQFPRAYHERSVLSHVKNINTPTIVISGAADLRTPIGEAEQFYAALKWLGVDTALVTYPDEYHGIRSRVSHHMGKVANILGWFAEHRAGDMSSAVWHNTAIH